MSLKHQRLIFAVFANIFSWLRQVIGVETELSIESILKNNNRTLVVLVGAVIITARVLRESFLITVNHTVTHGIQI